MPARSTDNPASGERVFTKRSQFSPAAGLLAGGLLAQNSRLGSAPKNAPLHQAIAFAKPLIASGLPDPLYDFRGGPRCSSKERDAETGLDYFEARCFSSAQGRFTSPDRGNAGAGPESPQTWNAYAYTGNNPLNAVDPDGLDCIYTDQLNSNGYVSVVRGNCISQNDGGAYVNGTVDLNSITYDPRSGTVGYSFSNDAEGTGGAGSISTTPSRPTAGQLPAGAAEILHQAGMMADAGLNASLSIMATNAGGTVAGRLIGLGAEALLAARAARVAAAEAAEISNLVSKAASTVGNQGARASSSQAALTAAEEWVGQGARPIVDRATGQFVGKISADGSKVYRVTSMGKA